MRAALFALLFACCALPVAGARAQEPRELENPQGKDMKHKPSGLTFPAALVGVQRSRMTAFSEGEWDVSARYDSAGTFLTVYVYQAAVFDPAIWFREAQQSIETRQEYGTATLAAPVASFAPPGDKVASGLRAVYATTRSTTATALAVAPLGTEWIVKIRLSSTSRTPAELEGDLTAVVTALDWPRRAALHAPVKPVADCTRPMPKLERANAVKEAGGAALFGGLFGNIAAASAAKSGPQPSTACRDTAMSAQYRVYRSEDGTGGYVLSLGDSGRAVIVEPDVLGALLAGAGKDTKTPDAKTTYLVKLIVPGLTTTFPALDGIPPVSQVAEIVNGGKWSSRTTRTAKGGNVTVNSDALK